MLQGVRKGRIKPVLNHCVCVSNAIVLGSGITLSNQWDPFEWVVRLHMEDGDKCHTTKFMCSFKIVTGDQLGILISPPYFQPVVV